MDLNLYPPPNFFFFGGGGGGWARRYKEKKTPTLTLSIMAEKSRRTLTPPHVDNVCIFLQELSGYTHFGQNKVMIDQCAMIISALEDAMPHLVTQYHFLYYYVTNPPEVFRHHTILADKGKDSAIEMFYEEANGVQGHRSAWSTKSYIAENVLSKALVHLEVNVLRKIDRRVPVMVVALSDVIRNFFLREPIDKVDTKLFLSCDPDYRGPPILNDGKLEDIKNVLKCLEEREELKLLNILNRTDCGDYLRKKINTTYVIDHGESKGLEKMKYELNGRRPCWMETLIPSAFSTDVEQLAKSLARRIKKHFCDNDEQDDDGVFMRMKYDPVENILTATTANGNGHHSVYVEKRARWAPPTNLWPV